MQAAHVFDPLMNAMVVLTQMSALTIVVAVLLVVCSATLTILMCIDRMLMRMIYHEHCNLANTDPTQIPFASHVQVYLLNRLLSVVSLDHQMLTRFVELKPI